MQGVWGQVATISTNLCVFLTKLGACLAKLGPFQPSLGDARPNLGVIFDQGLAASTKFEARSTDASKLKIRCDSGRQTWAELDLGRIRSIRAKVGPKSSSARPHPISAKCAPGSAESVLPQRKSGRIRPGLRQLCGRFGQSWPDIVQNLAGFDQLWAELGKSWPGRFGGHSESIGR